MRTANRDFKRWGQLADPHGGHLVGLTHPNYWSPKSTKWGKTQRVCWDFYKSRIDILKPLDALQINGDLIAGKNKKSGGRQLHTSDLHEQCEMTVKALLVADCDVIRITRGTDYHAVSDGDNWENIIVDLLKNEGITNIKIEDHGYYTFNKKNFDVKHHLSSSAIPYTRATAIDREIMQARQWHLDYGFPLPDVLIRSHTHYYKPAGDKNCIAFSTPALQGLGDEYGERRCSGTVHFGLVAVDVYNDGFIVPRPHILEGVVPCQPEVL